MAATQSLSSGGFTELDKYGRFVTTARTYAAATWRTAHEIGGVDFAAIQDWMCEPAQRAKSGLGSRA